MPEPQVEFINVRSIKAEAIGEPGSRSFRIIVKTSNSSALMWLEKEQLFQLAVAVNQLQGNSNVSDEAALFDSLMGEDRPETRVELRVGRLVIGYEENSNRFIIDVHDVDSEDEDGPTIRIWSNWDQLHEFADKALEVCAAGRPLCPLCSGPIDTTGHKCARANGHDVHRLSPND